MVDNSESLEFDEIYSLIKDKCLLGEKAKTLYDEAIKTLDVDGVVAEIGVFKGGTSKMLRFIFPEKYLYLYDSFNGIVCADPSIDKHLNGHFNEPLRNVQDFVGFEKTYYRAGVFPETFTEYDKMFSFVHSDTDTYFGTMETLKYFLPRLSIGGKIVFDDYEWHICPGVKKAIVDFFSNNIISYPIEVKRLSHPNQLSITRKDNFNILYICRHNGLMEDIRPLHKSLDVDIRYTKDVENDYYGDFSIFNTLEDYNYLKSKYHKSIFILWLSHANGNGLYDYIQKDNIIQGIISPSSNANDYFYNKIVFLQRKIPDMQSLQQNNCPKIKYRNGFYSYINGYESSAHPAVVESLENFRALKNIVKHNIDLKCFGIGNKYGFVSDKDIMLTSKATIHIKYYGIVCNAVIRSMCLGIPVLMDKKTHVEGNYDSVNGIYVFEDIEQLAKEIIKINRSDEYLLKLSIETKDWAEKQFRYTGEYGQRFMHFLNRLKWSETIGHTEMPVESDFANSFLGAKINSMQFSQTSKRKG